MDLLAVSVNHRTAGIELRERLHLSNSEVKELLGLFKQRFAKEVLIISTCNRTEVFLIVENKQIDYVEVERALIEYKKVEGVDDSNFEKYYSCSALNHLFKVVAGIDSQITGDNQIFGQVKESFFFAEEVGTVGFLMKRVFDAALKVGKRGKTDTLISEGAVTVSYAAVQLIEKIFSNFNKKNALVVGAGETGELAAKHLRDKGIGFLTITNRTYEKAEKLAERLNANVLPFDSFKQDIHKYDIVLSATASPEIVITYDDIRVAMNNRQNSPMVLMDIAVPRDIDPKVKKIENVFHSDMDSLNIIVEQNLKKRKDEIPKVKKIILDEMILFFQWYNSLEISPIIKMLRDLFEEVRSEEVGKNINKFSPEDQDKLEIITKRIMNKILHKPTTELRKGAEKDGATSVETLMKVAALKELFGLGVLNNSDKENL